MTSIRKAIALSLALGASLAASLPAAATVLGGTHYIPDGPVINSGDQHYVYVAWIRRFHQGEWEFRHIVTLNAMVCLQTVSSYASDGWFHNENQPGTACQPILVDGNARYSNPVTVIEIQTLSDAARGVYREGVRELRKKYLLEAYELEHEELLQAVKEVDGEGK